MVLPITIVKMIVIDFWFFFKIAANAKQKHKSEIPVSLKTYLSLFCSNQSNYHRKGQCSSLDGHYGYGDVGDIVVLMTSDQMVKLWHQHLKLHQKISSLTSM